MKDFDYESKDAKNLIEEAIVENVIKSMIFNGKVSCRIVRADSAADDTIIIPETQQVDFHDEENNATVTAEISKIENHLTGLRIRDKTLNNLYTELLKKRISELERILICTNYC